MTTAALTVPRAAAAAEPAPRFRDLLAAEWTKLWSLRSTPWGLALSALAVIGFNVNGAWADYQNWPGYSEPMRRDFIPYWALHDAFNNNSALILVLAAGALGAMMVVTEYASGLIRTTFAAVPARRSVMTAKVVVMTAVTTAHGVLIAGVSWWLTQAVLAGRHAGLSLDQHGAWQLLLASALLSPVSALVGMAIGTLVRTSATSVVLVILLLVVAPVSIPVNHHWQAVLAHALPYNAWMRVRQIEHPAWYHEAFPTTQGGAWLVLAVWALVAVAITVLPARRRDL